MLTLGFPPSVKSLGDLRDGILAEGLTKPPRLLTKPLGRVGEDVLGVWLLFDMMILVYLLPIL